MNKAPLIGGLAILALAALGAWSMSGDTPVADTRPPIDMTVNSVADLSTELRQAFMEGKPVRVHYENAEDESATPVKTKEYWSRKLTAEELVRGEKLINRFVKASNNHPHLEGKSALQQESLLAQSKKNNAMATTALKLLQEGQAFMTKGIIMALESNQDWHYWNVTFRTKPEGDVVIYVPIDLAKYPYVRSARDRNKDLREFTRTDDGYKWNALSYDERRQRVDAEREIRASMEGASASLEKLYAKKETGTLTQEEIDEMAALQARIADARARYVKVPKKLDPASLEWRR